MGEHLAMRPGRKGASLGPRSYQSLMGGCTQAQ